MSQRLGKVIGKSKFSNLDDFLITCYIVMVFSPLLGDSSTIKESLSSYTQIYATFLS